jgi:hypothetical protein
MELSAQAAHRIRQPLISLHTFKKAGADRLTAPICIRRSLTSQRPQFARGLQRDAQPSARSDGIALQNKEHIRQSLVTEKME